MMRILSADVNFTQAHTHQRTERQTHVLLEQGQIVQEQPLPFASTTVTLSQQALLNVNNTNTFEQVNNAVSFNMDIHTSLFKSLVEAMIGKKIQIGEFENTAASTQLTVSQSAISQPNTTTNSVPNDRITVNMRLVNEYEYSDISISAKLIDENSQQLDIAFNVSMERRYEQPVSVFCNKKD